VASAERPTFNAQRTHHADDPVARRPSRGCFLANSAGHGRQ
jgi:hypothetical protein